MPFRFSSDTIKIIPKGNMNPGALDQAQTVAGLPDTSGHLITQPTAFPQNLSRLKIGEK